MEATIIDSRLLMREVDVLLQGLARGAALKRGRMGGRRADRGCHRLVRWHPVIGQDTPMTIAIDRFDNAKRRRFKHRAR
jgi:hypothetical protein